jgi:hypothetical protein
MFERRAGDPGPERKRCRHPELDCDASPNTQRWLRFNDVDGSGDDDSARRRQHLGDRDQSFAPRLGSMAQRIDPRRRDRGSGQRRPARRRRRDDRLIRMRPRQAAERPAERERAEPLGPCVQSRVRGRLSDVRRPRRVAQWLVALDVRRRGRGDHGKPVALVRQHVGWQHAKPPVATAAPGQRHLQGPPLRHHLAAAVVDQQYHRTGYALPRQPQRNPTQPRGHSVVEGRPFNSAVS